MPAQFQWNRLIIRAQSEGEFCASFEENIEALLELEYNDIECDLTECVGLGPRAASLVHWAMVVFGDCGKSVTLRLPSTLQSEMQTTPVPKSVSLEWVMRMQAVPAVAAEEVTMVADTPEPKKRAKSDRRTSSRPLKDSSTSDDADTDVKPLESNSEDTVRTREFSSEIESHDGESFRADTAALLELSQGRRVDTESGIPESVIPEELIDSKSDLHKLGDGATTDRKAVVVPNDNATTNEVKIDKKGWQSSKWVDLGGAKAYLKYEGDGQERELGDEILIGRDAISDWVIDNPTVSKRHFRLFVSKNRWHVQDMDSTNGTFLNYLELRGPAVRISNGDTIALAVNDDAPEGTVRFEFRIHDPKEG